MEPTDFLLQLLAILLGARVLGELAVRLRIPAVIGEIAAGVVLGPSLFGWIQPTETLHLLAGIGVILLLFEVGLETDFSRLVRTGKTPFIVAAVGVLVPLAGGLGVCLWLFHLSPAAALFVGGALTATSIGITMRVFRDLKAQHTHAARVVLGAAVLDDVLGVLLLAMLGNDAEGSVNWVSTGRVLLTIVVFSVLAPVAGRLLSLLIRRFEATSDIPGLIPAAIVSLILLFAWMAHAAGAPELLGGFAAGLALTRRMSLPYEAKLGLVQDPDFLRRVETQIKPIVHLFSPIFFVFVGVSLDMRAINWGSLHIWLLTAVLLTVAVIGKLVAGLILLRETPFTRWVVGLAMVPRGEVGLMFAQIGKSAGVLGGELYAALILVIALGTLAPPLVLRWLFGKQGRPESDKDSQTQQGG
jgi:Kef-type K+ transport system membrane component KefB